MLQGLKNKIKKFFVFLKPKRLVAFGLLFFIIAVFLPRPVVAFSSIDVPGMVSGMAEWYKLWTRGNPLSDFGSTLILFAANSIVIITGKLALLSTEILGWAMNPTNISYTRSDNPVFRVGWSAVRDLANMFIVLGFILVGIATALRIGDYGAQKTLLPLILVALLINFTPLITGLIIDASNILMDHFLQGGGAFTQTYAKKIATQPAEVFEEGIQNNTTIALERAAGYAFFNIMMFLIFLLFAFLFLVRRVMLWVLVILSPLAFICYVFKFTRPIASMWWNQFFQWCIAGISGAFFLYLGDVVATRIAVSPAEASSYGSFFVFLLPGIMLLIGFLFTLQTSAKGAGVAIKGFNKAKGAMIGAGGFVAGRAWSQIKSKSQEVAAGATRTLGERMATMPTFGSPTSGKLRRGALAPLRMGGRVLGRGLMRLSEAERGTIDNAEKKTTGQTVQTQMAAYRKAKTDSERIGVLNAMVKDKNISEAMTRFSLDKSEVEKLYGTAQGYQRHNALRSALPEIAAKNIPPGTTLLATGGLSKRSGGNIDVALEHTLNQMKAADFGNISKDTLQSKDVMDYIAQKGTGAHIKAIVDTFGKEGLDSIEDAIKKLATTTGVSPENYLKNNNKALLNYFKKGGGRSFTTIF